MDEVLSVPCKRFALSGWIVWITVALSVVLSANARAASYITTAAERPLSGTINDAAQRAN